MIQLLEYSGSIVGRFDHEHGPEWDQNQDKTQT